MNGLIRKLIKFLGVKWLTGQVRAAAEGKLGAKWRTIYWGLAGKKRWISTLFGIGAGVAMAMGYTGYSEILASIAIVGISLGFVDKNWRDDTYDDWLKDSMLWRLLASNAPIISTAMAISLAWLGGTSCTLGDWCNWGSIAVGVIGAVFVQIGVVDAAWKATPPAIS